MNFFKNLNNTYIFDYRSTFYHDKVRVLPLNSQILGTQYSWVPKGNTQKNPKFRTLWVPNPKIPMVFRHKPNPTHTQILVRVRVLPLGTRILSTQSPPYDKLTTRRVYEYIWRVIQSHRKIRPPVLRSLLHRLSLLCQN